MTNSKLALFAMAALAAVSAPGLSWGQEHDMRNMSHDTYAAPANAATDGAEGSLFACENGSALMLDFAVSNKTLMAIVNVGDGAHTLPLKPWTGGEAQVTWSDGVRTLTWSPGVVLMWMDGPKHLMCGREHHHEE